jgi:hypothetical protein
LKWRAQKKGNDVVSLPWDPIVHDMCFYIVTHCSIERTYASAWLRAPMGPNRRGRFRPELTPKCQWRIESVLDSAAASNESKHATLTVNDRKLHNGYEKRRETHCQTKQQADH